MSHRRIRASKLLHVMVLCVTLARPGAAQDEVRHKVRDLTSEEKTPRAGSGRVPAACARHVS